jgi:hypothetical protein
MQTKIINDYALEKPKDFCATILAQLKEGVNKLLCL